MDNKHLNTLAGQIRLYIERVLPQLERAGGFPDSPMDRKSKGTSNPPVGEKALRLWWSYRDYATKLNPLLAEMRLHEVAYRGYEFREMIDHCVYDSASFGMRLAGDTKARHAFWQMCLLLAVALVQDWGEGVTLKVDDEPQEDEIADPRKLAPKWRTITARDGYHSIVARLERIRMEHPGITEAAAEVECQKELEELHGESVASSIGRIRDAKTFVNSERGGNGGEAA